MPSLQRLWSRSLAVLMLGIGLVVTGIGFARSAPALEPVGGHVVVTVSDAPSGAPLEAAPLEAAPIDAAPIDAALVAPRPAR